ncbi:MAG: hypothetical protein K0S23_3071 [Fluviicola sp.]|jgi:hypothetical protein|uniref:hypothetical protein n=1 Tax=Fluviicola sp. TaxID=1917219 RepID=UPI002613E765|nr:hypothetical protein [Fluviicola sp.]MDF3028764.1 hypothetical protein [Fluviicola sp.]
MKFLFFLSLTASLLFGCNTTKPITSLDQVISVTHGTNFGHCRGYCRKEVVFTEGQTEYIESSVDSAKNPVKVENFKNTSNWKSITDKINWEKFSNLQESYGCPDCADGGSEYIEIKTASGTKRVTIEFGKDLVELEPLLTELRNQRKKLGK